jgi:hypothetical protein
MALQERLPPPRQRPEGNGGPEAPGLGTGQRDHTAAGGLVMAAWTPGAWRVGYASQALSIDAVDPCPHPQGRYPDPLRHGRSLQALATGPDDLGALHQAVGGRA